VSAWELGEREQRVGAEFLPVVHQDREHDLLGREAVLQDTAASEPGDLGGELLSDGSAP